MGEQLAEAIFNQALKSLGTVTIDHASGVCDLAIVEHFSK